MIRVVVFLVGLVLVASGVFFFGDTLLGPAGARVAFWVIVLIIILAVFGALIWTIARRRTLTADQIAAEGRAARARRSRRREQRRVLVDARRGSRPRWPWQRLPDGRRRGSWWLVIGPAASGKTALITAMRASPDEQRPEPWNLEKPVRPSALPAGDVLLELPSALIENPRLREEWLSLLRALRRSWRRQPLDGVVVTAGVGTLLTSGEEEATALDAKWKPVLGALVDVADELGVVVPVHLVLTKCDEIPGLHTVLEHHPALREQDPSFGVEIEGFIPSSAGRQQVHEGYTKLIGLYERLARAHLITAETHAGQDAAYVAPDQLREIRPGILSLVELLGRAAAGDRDRLQLVGVFLTSATRPQRGQEVSPLRRAATELGLGVRPNDAEAPNLAWRPLGIGPLSSTVLPRAAGFAERTSRVERRQKAARWGVAAAGLGVALWIGDGAVTSARGNQNLLQEIAGEVHALGAATARARADEEVLSASAFEPLARDVEKLRSYLAMGPPPELGWGLFVDRVTGPVFQRYKQGIHDAVLVRLAQRLEAQLVSFATEYVDPSMVPSPGDRCFFHEVLRAYLLTTAPKGAGEHVAADGEWRAVASLWRASLHGLDRARTQGCTKEAHDSAAEEGAISTYVGLEGTFILPRTAAAVERAREVLKRVRDVDVVVREIVDVASAQSPKITVGAILNDMPEVTGTQEVRGAFTAIAAPRVSERIWMVVRAELGQPWVLGVDEKAYREAVTDRCAKLHSRYFELYVQEWDAFYRGLRIKPPRGIIESRDLYISLTAADGNKTPPLSRIFNVIRANTSALNASPDEVLNLCGPSDPSAVQKTFDPLNKLASSGLNDYHRLLEELLRRIREAGDNGSQPLVDDEFSREVKAGLAKTETIVREAGLEKLWKASTEQLLKTPLQGVSDQLEDAKGDGILGRWCEVVVLPMESAFGGGTYPFVDEASGHVDVDLADLRDFFDPEAGIVATFQRESLGRWVERPGDEYLEVDVGRSRLKINREVIRFLNRSRRLGKTIIKDGELRVDLGITLNNNTPVHTTEFKWGSGKTRPDATPVSGSVKYTGGSNGTFIMTWPMDAPDVIYTARGPKGAKGDVKQSGAWAIWRLLERADQRIPDPRGAAFYFDFTAKGLAKVKLAVRVFTPTPSDFFGPGEKFLPIFREGSLLPPRRLFAGGKACTSR